MRTLKVHDKAAILELTNKELVALRLRLGLDTGVKESAAIKKVRQKIDVELGLI